MRNLKKRTLQLVVAITCCAVLMVPSVASAGWGCLIEYHTCGVCAYTLMGRAILDLSFDEFNYAFLYGLDCDIDLFHCITFGMHHDYDCGI